MTRRKKIVIWAVVIVVLVGGFLALRISSWTRTYGLSKEVIAGTVEPTAEETVQLFFYCCNQRDFQRADELVTKSDMTEKKDGLPEKTESMINWLFMDRRILSIEKASNEEKPEETATDIIVFVQEAEGFLRVSPLTERENFDYKLVRTDVDHPWQIDEITTG